MQWLFITSNWRLILLFSFFFSLLLPSQFVFSSTDSSGLFSARIERMNPEARLIRLHIDFANMKYLNKGDKVEFWHETSDKGKCLAYIVGKSNEYLLVRVTDYVECSGRVFLFGGAYIRVFSQDLVNNIKMGKELFKILEKKRMALQNRMNRIEETLSVHMAKVEAVNDRYTVLRQKLEAEWQAELSFLEEERLKVVTQQSSLQIDVQDINRKVEQYRVDDENLKYDRWALDSNLYIKK